MKADKYKITQGCRDEFRKGVSKLLYWYGWSLMDESFGYQLWDDLAEYFTHK